MTDGCSGLREKCGVFGIIGSGSDLQYCVLGLRALQHRGQEASGVAVMDGGELKYRHNNGLVDEVVLCESLGTMCAERLGAVGHVRYSTSGDKSETNNVQPIIIECQGEKIAIAHNGNFTNAESLRRQMSLKGVEFTTGMDSEVLARLMQNSEAPDIIGKLKEALQIIEGAYSLIILSKEGIIGVRDRLAIRPLALGVLGNSYVLASESCALDAIGALLVRDIEGGEAVILSGKKETSVRLFEKTDSKHCIFEYIYFSRPDSVIDGMPVYQVRKELGRALARAFPVPGADVVAPVPESSVAAALGYAEACGLPFDLGITRNSYVTRTFIQPSESRNASLCVKHNVNRSVVQGKSVVLVDDSLVRGNTARSIVAKMRECGAKEVHMRIASPPVTNCCYYGIDTPDITQLIATRMSREELRIALQLDSLEYVTVDDMYLSTIGSKRDQGNPQFCDACFTGDYPVAVLDATNQAAGCTDIIFTKGTIHLEGNKYNHRITKESVLDKNLLALDPIFSSVLKKYSLGISHNGVYIFLSRTAASSFQQNSRNGEDNFIQKCVFVITDNLCESFASIGHDMYSKIGLIVNADDILEITHDNGHVDYHVKPNGYLSWRPLS